jgi:hypothetical protein
VVEAALAGAAIARLFSLHVAHAVKDGRLSLLLQQFEPPQLPSTSSISAAGCCR